MANPAGTFAAGLLAWTVLSGWPASAVSAPAAGSPQCPAKLRWTNATGAAVTLDVDGVGPRALAAGSTAAICKAAGSVGYLVQAVDWMYRGTLDVANGDQRTVRVRTPGGSLTVDNRSAELQAIRIDGAAPADLPPGQAKVFGPLAPGDHRVSAESLRSSGRWGAVVAVAAGKQATVVVPAPHGKLKLRNPLEEPARVIVDGQPFGQVGTRAELWVVGVGPGGHAVRWQGEVSGKRVDETWLADDPAARRSGTIALQVRNRSGEDLKLPPELAHLGGVLPAEATPTWSVLRGDYRIHATGSDSGLDYWFDVRGESPAMQTWRIDRPTATLRVVNQSGEPATLSVHGARVTTITHGAEATLKVPAGRLQLRATLASRREPQTAGMHLLANEQGLWKIAARDTHIVAINRWPEPLDVRLDGRRVALVAAGGDVRMPVRPGDHTVTAIQHRLGWQESSRVTVRDGDRVQTLFHPPGAALALDNRRSADPATLEVEGKGIRAAGGERAALPVGAGTVHARSESAEGVQEKADHAAAPTQQLDVQPPPRRQVQLTVVGAADRAVSVQLDDGERRIVAAGARWVAGNVTADSHLVTVVDGARVVRKLVRFDGRRAAVELRIGGR